jgi:transcription initiation factor IIE alpha subunit
MVKRRQLDLFNPDTPPHQRHSDTSRAAVESVRDRVSARQLAVLRFLHRRGRKGATDEEMQEALHMEGNSLRPTRVSLRDRGLVLDRGQRRPTKTGRLATVWEIKE